jgi:bifunctional DNase/RNase
MSVVISTLGGNLEYCMIDRYYPEQQITYEAKLYIRQRFRTHIIDVRPSDAVVLAVVCKMPIAVSADVIEQLPQK